MFHRVFLAVLFLSTVAFGQNTFVTSGLTVTGSGGVGSDYSIGVFGEGNYTYKRFDLNGLASIDYEPKDGVSRNYVIRLRPELRFTPKSFGWFDPFVGAGVQYTRTDNDQWNKAGFNYVGTVGAHFLTDARGVPLFGARISRIFTDRTNLNINRLEGWRYGLDINAMRRVRASFEYTPFNYFQPMQGRVDGWSMTFRTGYVF